MLSMSPVLYGQDQQLADSLKTVLSNLERNEQALPILSEIAINENDPETKLQICDEIISIAELSENHFFLHQGHLQKGQVFRVQGNYEGALELLLVALNEARIADYPTGIGGAHTAIADVYSLVGDHTNSVQNYLEGIKILSAIPDSSTLAIVMLNLGDEYYLSSEFDSALYYFDASRNIYEKIQNDPSGKAYSLGNIGLVLAETGNYSEANDYVSEAIETFEELRDHYAISVFLHYMADILSQQEQTVDALKYAERSLETAKKYGFKSEIRDASLQLSRIHENLNHTEAAFRFHKDYVAYRDSLNNEEVIRQMADLRRTYEMSQKQAEVDLLESQRENQIISIVALSIILFLSIILAVVILLNARSKSRINKMLQDQKRDLEHLNQTKDKFFSIISHDLRGPMHAIHGIAEVIKLLNQNGDREQIDQIANDMDKTTRRLTNLLDNLLAWASGQQGQIPLNPQKIETREMIQELFEMQEYQAKAKQIELINEIPKDEKIWADKNTILTVFRNLIGNALKYSTAGDRVSVSCTTKNGLRRIAISDQGVGMSTQELKELNHPTSNLSTYGTQGEKGIGLGLRLAKEFVALNQGELHIESKKNIGTTVYVSIPTV
jgi:signal transduction histidine kinase